MTHVGNGLDPIFPPNVAGVGTDNPPVNAGYADGHPSGNQQTETGYPITGAGHGRMFPPGGGTDTHPEDV